jgi:hypothetical protein
VLAVLFLIWVQLGWIGASAAQSEQRPMGKIQSGLFEGIRFDSEPNAAAFLGIPFAAPLVKELNGKFWGTTGDSGMNSLVCAGAGWDPLLKITSQGTWLGSSSSWYDPGAERWS